MGRRRLRSEQFSGDTRRLLGAQGARAFAYGIGALLLGTTLAHRGLSSLQVGLVLGAVVAGTVIGSVGVARVADRWGRRRCYASLYVVLALAGAAFALSRSLWVLLLAALTGTISVDIVDSSSFTSLEQAMLATDLVARSRMRGFGLYNAVAAAAGSLGALAAGGPSVLRQVVPHAPGDQRFFLVFVPVGMVGAILARSLSARVELGIPPAGASEDAGPAPAGLRDGGASVRPPRPWSGQRLGRSRRVVTRLAALFAADAFAGGFVVPAFIAYWLRVRFGTATPQLGLLFFGIGLLQAASFLLAIRLVRRFGLLRTMVFSHLPSNVLLVAVAFAPSLAAAAALLLARALLSQMDVPTRQAYVMALVEPGERAAAAGYTNGARYTTRPLGPLLAGAGQGLFAGLPFVLAGSIKVVYDLVLWRWFRRVPLPDDEARRPGAPPALARGEPPPRPKQVAPPSGVPGPT